MNIDAQWIWTGLDPDAPGQMAQFRVVFDRTASANWIGFADTLYTVFCNGRVLGVGPTLGHHRQPFLTEWYLTLSYDTVYELLRREGLHDYQTV